MFTVSYLHLAPQAKSSYDVTVAFNVTVHQVIEQSPPLTDEF
jgi:hypothetical protein